MDRLLTKLSISMRQFGQILCLSILLANLLISNARSELPKATLDQLKRATVMVKVRAQSGKSSSGSGFFIRENLVVTNAHVLQLQQPWEKIDGEVEIVYASGTSEQKTLRCTVLSVDVPRDLAFLNLVDDFKGPIIPLAKSDSIKESTPVYVLGFPLGERLALNGESPAITIVTGHVSAFRRDQFGSLDAIQLNATLIPGNSGGPVVDSKGHLVGISRATLSLTKVGFAIPVQHVEEDLAGRVTASAVTVLDDQSGIEIKLRVADPLQKISRIAAYYWTSEKDAKLPLVPGTEIQTHGAVGDSSRSYSEFKADKDVKDLWSGRVPNLEVSESRELWLQFALAIGKQLRLQPPICHSRDARARQTHLEELADADKSPQYKQFEARLKDASPLDLKPSVEPVMFAERLSSADTSNTLGSTVIKRNLSNRKILDVVAAPRGQWIYVIIEDDPHVWVLDSGSLETVRKIVVAQSPISLGIHRDSLAVACNESQSVQIIDGTTHEVVHTLRIADKELHPKKLMGTAPDGSLMTLWRRNQDAKSLCSLYLLDWDKQRPPLKLVEAHMDCCVMARGRDKVIAQSEQYVPDIVPGRPYLLPIAEKPLPSAITLTGRFLNYTVSRRCYFCSRENLLLVPAEALMDGKFQRITLLKDLDSNADSRFLPGYALPQFVGEGHVISIDWAQDNMTFQAIVHVNSLNSKQILKTIRIDGFSNALAISSGSYKPVTDMVYVPGRELIVATCESTPGIIYAAPCATPID